MPREAVILESTNVGNDGPGLGLGRIVPIRVGGDLDGLSELSGCHGSCCDSDSLVDERICGVDDVEAEGRGGAPSLRRALLEDTEGVTVSAVEVVHTESELICKYTWLKQIDES